MSEINDKENLSMLLYSITIRITFIVVIITLFYLYLSFVVFSYKDNYIVIINESGETLFNNIVSFTLVDEKGEIWKYDTSTNYFISTGNVKIYAIPKPFISGTLIITDSIDEFKIDFKPRGRRNHSLFVKINDDNTLSYEWDKIPN